MYFGNLWRVVIGEPFNLLLEATAWTRDRIADTFKVIRQTLIFHVSVLAAFTLSRWALYFIWGDQTPGPAWIIDTLGTVSKILCLVSLVFWISIATRVSYLLGTVVVAGKVGALVGNILARFGSGAPPLIRDLVPAEQAGRFLQSGVVGIIAWIMWIQSLMLFLPVYRSLDAIVSILLLSGALISYYYGFGWKGQWVERLQRWGQYFAGILLTWKGLTEWVFPYVIGDITKLSGFPTWEKFLALLNGWGAWHDVITPVFWILLFAGFAALAGIAAADYYSKKHEAFTAKRFGACTLSALVLIALMYSIGGKVETKLVSLVDASAAAQYEQQQQPAQTASLRP